MRSIKVGDVVRQTLSGYPSGDVFTVLEIKDLVIDDSFSRDHQMAYEVVALWHDGMISVERLQLRHIENEFFSHPEGPRDLVLRTEIL